jgi:ribonuclease BN (tRNA processing enzyme)
VRLALFFLTALAWGVADAGTGCTGKGVEIQVLGSGGPELEDKRASTSYLIWREGKARVLVDAGGGSALRFGESGARMEDLDVVLFSHFHIDHAADFPALMFSSYFGERTRPLPVYGPGGNGDFPATTEFVSDLFNPARGTYRYLGEFLKGHEGGYALQAHDVRPEAHEVQRVFVSNGIAASAAIVIHGSVPALGWRVEVDGRTVVFSGDGNGDNGNLEKLARDADIFVAHNAVPDGITGALRALHMPPSVIGRIAATANVRHLVLSHLMLRTLGRESDTRTSIARNYAGPVTFAEDLDCFK